MFPLAAVLIGPAWSCGGVAQGGDCLPDDDVLENLWGYARQLGTDTTTSFADRRLAYDIPLTTLSEVQPVFDSAVCRRAAQAYEQELDLPGQPSVYVVRIGTRYVVLDPDTKRGEFSVYLVLDMNFDRVAGWGG